MRLPFELTNSKFEENARVKFSYTSPELHQNIEVSMDGEDTTVEALLDAFQRFLGALGIMTPDNVVLGFIEMEDLEDDDSDKSDENGSDEDSKGPNNKRKK